MRWVSWPDGRGADNTARANAGTEERNRPLALSGLPSNIRRDLVATLGPRGATMVHALDAPFRPERIVVAMAALALLILPAFFLVNFGGACDSSQSLVWSSVDAACRAPFAYVVVRAFQNTIKRASRLVAPGVYIALGDVIIALGDVTVVRGDQARFVPIASLAGIGEGKRVANNQVATNQVANNQERGAIEPVRGGRIEPDEARFTETFKSVRRGRLKPTRKSGTQTFRAINRASALSPIHPSR